MCVRTRRTGDGNGGLKDAGRGGAAGVCRGNKGI